VGGFKANGEPYPAFLIVKAKMMHKEFTYSWVEDKDGNPMKVTLPSLMSGGREMEALVVCTANGGMNPELNKKYMDMCIIPAHPLLSPTDQIIISADGDESHVCTGERLRELKDMGVNIIAPKPNTTQDCAPPDLVTFGVMQSAVRSAIATRQRLLRKMAHHRPLDYRDMVATLALAIEKGMTRKNCMAAYEEAGLYPFTSHKKASHGSAHRLQQRKDRKDTGA